MNWLRLIEIYLPSALRLGGAGIQFLNTILITRLLGGADESSPYLFWSLLIMNCSFMATYGMEQLVLRDIPRLQDRKLKSKSSLLNQYFRAIRLISVIGSFVVGLGIFTYALISQGWQPWSLLIPFAVIAITTVFLNGEILKAFEKPVQGVLMGHFIPAVLFLIAILIFTEKVGAVGLVVVWFVCFFIAAFVVKFSNEAEMRKSHLFKRPHRDQLKPLLREGFPVFISNCCGTMTLIIPLAMLQNYHPGQEVSFVNTAIRISILFAVLSNAVYTVYSPKLSRAAENVGNRREMYAVYRKAIIAALGVMLIPLSVCLLAPSTIMSIFGEGFTQAGGILQGFLIFNLATMIIGPAIQLTVMTGNSKVLTYTGVGKLTLALILSILLVPRFAGLGLVAAASTACFLEEIVLLVCIWRGRRNGAEKEGM